MDMARICHIQDGFVKSVERLSRQGSVSLSGSRVAVYIYVHGIYMCGNTIRNKSGCENKQGIPGMGHLAGRSTMDPIWTSSDRWTSPLTDDCNNSIFMDLKKAKTNPIARTEMNCWFVNRVDR